MGAAGYAALGMKSQPQAESAFAARIPGVRVTYAFWKRILDIVGSALLMLLLSPVLVVIAATVMLTSPGPMIYRQQRVGKGGRLFPFYKFRSMYKDADKRLEELMGANEKQGPIFK